MTANTVRVTKAQKFTAIKSLLDGENFIEFPGTEEKEGVIFDADAAREFLDAEIALLNKKNSGGGKTEAQKAEDASFMDEILDVLLNAEGDGLTSTQIFTKIPSFAESEYGTQKVTSLLKIMQTDGKVAKKVVKGKSYFSAL